ncbi:PhyH-domain-containing protein [Zopfia rhizophila CBS 207.26]|uniref:PhyH-domain-containing protein n=1 Tax=Zopfia rhizophila CBS 207.26 TaxID=1314779 RepID=A0A6A6DAS8_9PEZI|nr:PhyH-domain-containing protein [Zopfia rhizophila CBS 207.26]
MATTTTNASAHINGAASKPTLRRVPRTTSAKDIVRIIQEDGGVIVEQFLLPEQVQSFNKELDPEIEKIPAGSQHENDSIVDFHGKQTKRPTRPINSSPTFRNEILNGDLSHEICEAIFPAESGDYWVLSSQVIEIGPGNKAQPLHRDHGNFPVFHDLGPRGPEAVLNHLIALTDFTDENGATRVIPKSNHWENFNDMGNPDETIPAEMKAGDALVISGKVLHGGGQNKTKDFYRRAVSFSFCPSYLVPEEPYPFMADLEEVRKWPVRVQKILGFRSQYPKDTPGLWQIDYCELGDYLKL